MANDVWEELKPRQQAIERSLRELFDAQTGSMPAILRAAMEYSLFAGGKRLRPLFCGLACETVGGQFEMALPVGIALEMIHTYSLIHDDLPSMDDDDLRRGRPTCHKVYGEALAILAGDGLQSLAFGVVASSYLPAKAAVMMCEMVRGAGGAGMVGGQVLDLMADGRIPKSVISDPRTIEYLELIHRRKTGALFRTALLCGSHAAEEEADCADLMLDHRNAWLSDYADAFGLLFQITDDLLDAEGNAESTGKKTGKDANRGKLTYPGLLGVAASKAKASELANQSAEAAGRFGERGEMLARLARFVERRDR